MTTEERIRELVPRLLEYTVITGCTYSHEAPRSFQTTKAQPEITLEDVLEALHKIEQRGFPTLTLSNGVQFFEEFKDEAIFFWQYGLPLSQQSQETIDFIDTLIKPLIPKK